MTLAMTAPNSRTHVAGIQNKVSGTVSKIHFHEFVTDSLFLHIFYEAIINIFPKSKHTELQ